MNQSMPSDDPAAGVLRPQRFVVQVARSLGMRVSASGLNFTMSLACAYALNGSASAYGEYAQAIAWMNILVIIAKLGFDTASLRYLSQYRTQGETGLLRGFVKTSRRYTFASSIVIALCFAGVTMLLRERIAGGVFWCLLTASLLLPIMAGIQLREAGLLAFGRVMTGQTSGVLLPLLLIALVWTVPLATGHDLSSSSVVLLHLSSAVLTLGMLSLLSRKFITSPSGSSPAEARVREWMFVASPLLLVQLLNVLQNQSGTVMCGSLVGSEAAGLYSAVARVAGVLFLGLQAINTIAAPTISSLYHSGRTAELEQFVRRCALGSFGFGASFALVMLVCGRWLLGWFGAEFISGYTPMLIILGGLALASATGPVNHLMLMTGGQWDCIKIYGANVAVCLTLGFFLIPPYGVLGAAITAALARIGSSVALVLAARRRHGLWCVADPFSTTSVSTRVSPESTAHPPRIAA